MMSNTVCNHPCYKCGEALNDDGKGAGCGVALLTIALLVSSIVSYFVQLGNELRIDELQQQLQIQQIQYHRSKR